MNVSEDMGTALAKFEEALKLAKTAVDINTAYGSLGAVNPTLGTGLTGVNLDAKAKLIVPILAPYRQRVGRVTRPGIGTNWKYITGLTRGGTFKSADKTRSSGFTISTAVASALYAEYGKFGDVSWSGSIAGANFEDLRARAEILTLLQFLRDEESAILGATVTALGAGPTPVLSQSASGGALSDGALFVYLVPLSQHGVIGASRIARPIAGNKYDFTTPPTLNLLDGVGLPTAANTTITLNGGGAAQSLTITWTWAKEAMAYAVYIGTASGSANAKLQGIVTQAKVVVTSTNTTGAAPNTADTSNNGPFVGMRGQLVVSGSGAYVKDQAAAPLSAAVGRGIPEIDAMCNDIFDRVKEDPDRLLMNWSEHQAIDDSLAAVSNDRVKFNVNVTGETSSEVLPRFTTYKTSRGKSIFMEENPNLPGGCIMALKDAVQIPDSEIPNAWQMHMGRDMQRLDYAFSNPLYEFEIRAFGALAGYAPSFQGLIYNIAKF